MTIAKINPLDAIIITTTDDLYVALLQQGQAPFGAFEVRLSPRGGEYVVVRAGTTGAALEDWAGAIRPGVSSASADFRIVAMGVHKMLNGGWLKAA